MPAPAQTSPAASPHPAVHPPVHSKLTLNLGYSHPVEMDIPMVGGWDEGVAGSHAGAAAEPGSDHALESNGRRSL